MLQGSGWVKFRQNHSNEINCSLGPEAVHIERRKIYTGDSILSEVHAGVYHLHTLRCTHPIETRHPSEPDLQNSGVRGVLNGTHRGSGPMNIKSRVHPPVRDRSEGSFRDVSDSFFYGVCGCVGVCVCVWGSGGGGWVGGGWSKAIPRRSSRFCSHFSC